MVKSHNSLFAYIAMVDSCPRSELDLSQVLMLFAAWTKGHGYSEAKPMNRFNAHPLRGPQGT
jgi:hypothetical protein